MKKRRKYGKREVEEKRIKVTKNEELHAEKDK